MSTYAYATPVIFEADNLSDFTGSQLERNFASGCTITPVSTTL